MTISPQQVKELREKTGAGMMECKKALSESGGNPEAAFEYLRKKGLNALASKSARVAAEGTIACLVSDDARAGVLVEINCETDFAAKNEDFSAFARETASLVARTHPASVEILSQQKISGGQTILEQLNLLAARIGEKMDLRRFVRVETKSGETIGSYLHLGNKIGVLVVLGGSPVEGAVVKDIAMHVAAAHPLYLNRADIPADVLEKEKSIYREQMASSGKPPEILEKIIQGKLAKFAAEICLNEQVFIKDPTGKQTVAQVLKAVNPALKVVSYMRYQVGEGLEKKKDDFVAEVAKMAK